MTPGPTLAQIESLLNLAINSSVACHAKTELRPGLELKLGFVGLGKSKVGFECPLHPILSISRGVSVYWATG